MRFDALALALVAAATIPVAAAAQSAMSHDAMAMAPPTMATLMCRKATDKDTHGGMMSTHEIAATTSDGDKLVCRSTAEMHAMMGATESRSKAASDAAAATRVWQDFLTTQVLIPYGGG